MDELRYTLLSDGRSDQALMPLLNWILRQQGIHCAIQPDWADLPRLPRPPKSLPDRILRTLELYPCDLLFIHRDAENQPRQIRVDEIKRAMKEVARGESCPAVCVVPVRMQEAWLLFDEAALRKAAGNQSGRQPLDFPPTSRLEQVPDPKGLLYELLREASGLAGRRRQRFPARLHARRVAEFITDFTPLRVLPAFRALESDLGEIISEMHWTG